VDGGPGADVVAGGSGDDIFAGITPADTVRSGPGADIPVG